MNQEYQPEGKVFVNFHGSKAKLESANLPKRRASESFYLEQLTVIAEHFGAQNIKVREISDKDGAKRIELNYTGELDKESFVSKFKEITLGDSN